ncbi:MAG: GEVED domain-containing protein [Planctomycetota bacterium]
MKRRRLKIESCERRVLLAAQLEAATTEDAAQWWMDRDEVQGPVRELTDLAISPELSPIRAQEFRLLSLNRPALEQELDRSFGSADQVSTVPVPRPDGSVELFEVRPNGVMSAGLQEQFPEIRTFTGVSANGDRLYGDLTPSGFHAMVLSNDGNYFVDPFYYVDDRLYASYFVEGEFLNPQKNVLPPTTFDLPKSTEEALQAASGLLNADESSAEGEDTGGNGEDNVNDPADETPRTGTVLRTYRLAVAATGEYTTFHGGTVAAGQAAIVTAVNRVTGIYETELSISFEIVPNNELLVYTNGGTDPYTNNNGVAMLAENQTNVDNIIGAANYDIGHVFSTGGGGIASLGSVGINNFKARGVTGLPSPINDVFYVDFVAHEMGHQFGGNHTFNGDSGSCSGGNRNGSTAYEPGSGSTIQAYAGICGNDNLQNNSDPFFHSVSLDEMLNHVDNRIPLVGIRTATGNNIPEVDGGLDYTIPAQTPFELTATGSDADGDTVTYSWEQRDLGPQADVNAGDDGQGPLFRFWDPTESPTRTFPRLSDLLVNTTVIGETLPTTNRSLNFRVTARDSRAGGGGVATDDIRLTVIDTGQPFAITSPNMAVDWPALSTQTVTWNVSGTDAGAIDADFVNILLSTDGGNNFDITLASAVPNDGSHELVVPEQLTTTARVKVIPTDNVFFDISNTNFTISEAQFTMDFGDAPSPYPVLASDNGPRHTTGGPVLGQLVDTESDGQPSVGATGDGADEDGLAIPAPLVVGQNGELTVTASTAGELDLFIDFDGDGVFGNTAAEIMSQTLAAGDNTVSIAIPADAVENTFARLRISSAGGLGPTGPANDGEVEDHAISIFQSAPELDYGDALGYGSLTSNDGARHVAMGPTLGLARDAEEPTSLDATATSDGRDDDGVVFTELLLPGESNRIEVSASAAGVLDFFVDFDGDGTFGNVADEVFSQAVVAGTQDVVFDVPATAQTGTTYARFRLSTNGGVGPTGLAPDGEVEDYQVVVAAPERGEVLLENFDFGTAPALPFGWTTTTDPEEWTTVSDQFDTSPNSVFAPDTDVVTDIRLDSPSIPIEVTDTLVRFQNFFNTEATFDGGVLEISVNNGPFDDILDAGGTFVTGGYNSTIDTRFGSPIAGRGAWSGNSGSFIETVVQLPNSMVGSDVTLRWRMATDSSVDATGWWIDTISHDARVLELDYGDALGANFPTLAQDDGAAHLIETLRLGAELDAEFDGIPNANADGDDLDATDDEDGVLFDVELSPGSNDVVVNASDTGIVNIWIDVDGDAAWDSAEDHVLKDVPVAAGDNILSFDLPPTLAVGTTPARVRLSNQAGLAPGGFAGDGEVEDHLVSLANNPPVTVENISVNDGEVQRSSVTSVEVTFSGIATASPAAFAVTNRVDASAVGTDVQFSEVDGKTIATITFLDGANVVTRPSGNSLIDGNFQLTIDANAINELENSVDFGTVAADLFYRFYGDSDGDRDTDGQDYGRFAGALFKPPTDPDFDPMFDFDGDDDIDGQDYGQFSSRLFDDLPFA